MKSGLTTFAVLFSLILSTASCTDDNTYEAVQTGVETEIIMSDNAIEEKDQDTDDSEAP